MVEEQPLRMRIWIQHLAPHSICGPRSIWQHRMMEAAPFWRLQFTKQLCHKHGQHHHECGQDWCKHGQCCCKHGQHCHGHGQQCHGHDLPWAGGCQDNCWPQASAAGPPGQCWNRSPLRDCGKLQRSHRVLARRWLYPKAPLFRRGAGWAGGCWHLLWGPVCIKAEWPHFLQFTADLFCGGGKFYKPVLACTTLKLIFWTPEGLWLACIIPKHTLIHFIFLDSWGILFWPVLALSSLWFTYFLDSQGSVVGLLWPCLAVTFLCWYAMHLHALDFFTAFALTVGQAWMYFAMFWER